MSEEVELDSTATSEGATEAEWESAEEQSLASVILVERDEEIATICGRIDSAPTLRCRRPCPPRKTATLSARLGSAACAATPRTQARRSPSRRAPEAWLRVPGKPRFLSHEAPTRFAGTQEGGSPSGSAAAASSCRQSAGSSGLVALVLAILGVAGTVVFAGPTATVTVYPETRSVERTNRPDGLGVQRHDRPSSP